MQLLKEIGVAQRLSGVEWPKEYKRRTLRRYLDRRATKHFHKMKGVWSSEEHTVEHERNKMVEVSMEKSL